MNGFWNKERDNEFYFVYSGFERPDEQEGIRRVCCSDKITDEGQTSKPPVSKWNVLTF